MIEPVIASFGLDLVGVELAQEGNRTILWVYIDHDDGVTIDHCAQVSPEVSAAIDVEDPLADAYELRVSSPGLDRPLMSVQDFVTFAGEKAHLQLSTPLEGRRKFTGVLADVTEGGVGIDCPDGEHRVPIAYIKRARLLFELERGKKKK
jgi:ribosome maturation factor RimP